jgi:hypothetical protein
LCLANFSLPAEEDSPFIEIKYVELDREGAKEVVELYNKVSKSTSGTTIQKCFTSEIPWTNT